MRLRWLGVWLVAGLGMSCTSTHQVRHATTSGFLGDYSQMTKGGKGNPLLIYRDAEADFTAYRKIQIEPVVGYIGPRSRFQKLSPEDRQALLNYFHATLQEQLGADYDIVDDAGPGVLRLRVAVTDAQGSKVAMDTLSTVVPVGLALSALEKVALGKTLTAGSVRIEAEALDGATGKRLAAMVDERSGAKLSGRLDKWSRWQDARDAFDFWGARLRSRLAKLREQGAGDT